MSIGRLLIHKCDIYRHTDKRCGNFTKKEPEKIFSNKRCRFIRKTATNSNEMGRVKVNTYYVLMIPKSVRVENGDLVYWIAGEYGQEMRFKVEEPYSPSGKYNRVTIERESEA